MRRRPDNAVKIDRVKGLCDCTVSRRGRRCVCSEEEFGERWRLDHENACCTTASKPERLARGVNAIKSAKVLDALTRRIYKCSRTYLAVRARPPRPPLRQPSTEHARLFDCLLQLITNMSSTLRPHGLYWYLQSTFNYMLACSS